MDPVTLSALIGAGTSGAQLGGGLFTAKKNREYQDKWNSDNRLYSQEMYNKTRQDALQDRDFENAYNSPKQQMQRLKEAGLNPRLIYGGSTGIMSSSSARAATMNNPNTEAPKFDMSQAGQGLSNLGEVLGKFFQQRNLEAQTDNLRETRELIEAQTDATRAGIPYTESQTNMSNFNLEFAKKTEQGRIKQLELTNSDIQNQIDTRNYDVSRKKELLPLEKRELQAKIKMLVNDDKRKAEIGQAEYSKLWNEAMRIEQETLKTKQERDNMQVIKSNLQTEGRLKAMEAVLRAYGINPNGNSLINDVKTVISNPFIMNQMYDIQYQSQNKK